MENSIYYQDYPKAVSAMTNKIIESLEEDSFFVKEGACQNVTFKKFAEAILPKWIKGNMMEIFSDEEFTSILNESIIQSKAISLTERGYLDFIEDEKGEIHYFLTQKGKEAIK